ncbi:MlaD family protein [Paraconexibacter antarcticus]|uniref:MlaD family protein n=1 Tax=Paraconexibacter antarcticus TaxID=2949664 RepID=A0ABY5DXJ0_9ACTN|nr:MlaD family protein [Paraconexibacter antarcticus]UTI66740.1 MlaD family protein [Paraconexibacter antarcticus]
MARRSWSVVLFLAVACAGLVAAAYVLVHERAPIPFRHTYQIKAQVTAAHGIAPGLGQPVQVAGVQVGTVAGLRATDGRALVTLEIDRSRLRRVYANARVSLVPVTPLKDMQVELDPGRPPAPSLADGATVDIARTRAPVPLADLLSSLDADTREFFTSLLASVEQGTTRQGVNLRRLLRTLGPTVGQLHGVSAALAQRRVELARLVHNLARVSDAAASDGRLRQLVSSANTTLLALAEQERPLRQSVARLPGTLRTTAAALADAGGLARALQPTIAALRPATRRLPAALDAARPFAQRTARVLSEPVRPFVAEAAPVLRDAGAALTDLRSQVPGLVTNLKGTNYVLNELAYNPPGQKLGFDDEGFLYWAPWWFHNFNSLFSTGDAHGSAARAIVMFNCEQLSEPVLGAAGPLVKLLLGASTLCPER